MNYIFDGLFGESAIGHVRYSTTGDSDKKNVGPLTFNMGNYSLSIAHNGNLVNIENIRKELQEEGALFQTSTDTEITIHLIAYTPLNKGYIKITNILTL